MKKNMIYLAMGIVFLILAVCIAYVFTEPAQNTVSQEAVLQEQDAGLLTAEETPQTLSTDSLVFNAQDNTAAITTPPPAPEENQKTEELQAMAPDTAPENIKPQANTVEEKISETKQEAPAPAPALENKEGKSEKQEAKPVVLQDKLPVPFVKDSLKTRSVLSPKKNFNTIVYAELMMDGNQVGLVFEGDKPIKPKTFRLNNPERVVVDIEGYWLLKLPKLISNRMVKDIRSNAQKDKTRIVFDLKVPVSSSLLYRIHSRKYQLVFK